MEDGGKKVWAFSLCFKVLYKKEGKHTVIYTKLNPGFDGMVFSNENYQQLCLILSLHLKHLSYTVFLGPSGKW